MEYINGVYIPSGLLIVGTLIVKQDWLPFAVILALALGAVKIFSGGMWHIITRSSIP